MASTISRSHSDDGRNLLAANLAVYMARHPFCTSQSALARASGVPQRTIGRILNRETHAELKIIGPLAAALGIALWKLFYPISEDDQDISSFKGRNTFNPT